MIVYTKLLIKNMNLYTWLGMCRSVVHFSLQKKSKQIKKKKCYTNIFIYVLLKTVETYRIWWIHEALLNCISRQYGVEHCQKTVFENWQSDLIF